MKTVNVYRTLILSAFCCCGTIANAAPPITVAPRAIPANKITLELPGINLQSEALAFQFGAEITSSIGGGGGGGKLIYRDLIITRRVDASSQDLVNALITGKLLEGVIIKQGVLTVQAELATISDYQIDAAAGKIGYQDETITLQVANVTISSTP